MEKRITEQSVATRQLVRELYRSKTSVIESQFVTLNQRLEALVVVVESAQIIADRNAAFAEIQQIGLEKFWAKSDIEINRLLH